MSCTGKIAGFRNEVTISEHGRIIATIQTALNSEHPVDTRFDLCDAACGATKRLEGKPRKDRSGAFEFQGQEIIPMVSPDSSPDILTASLGDHTSWSVARRSPPTSEVMAAA